MERSSKFISLSGLAGVLAGVYALAGAGLGYWLIKTTSGSNQSYDYMNEPLIFWQLFMIALAVLVFSVVTACGLTIRKVAWGLSDFIRFASIDSSRLWAAGFGVLHIIYGSMMHFKYER